MRGLGRWRGAATRDRRPRSLRDHRRSGPRGRPGALQEAADLYQGDLLPDCAGEWIEAERERLRRRPGVFWHNASSLLEQDRAYGDAIDAAQQLLRLIRLDESAWCALMRCHARRGERATALHLYQQCAALLKKELGVQPSAATRRPTGRFSSSTRRRRLAPVRHAPRLPARRPTPRVAGAAQRLARRGRRPTAVVRDSWRSGHRQDPPGGGTGRLVPHQEHQRGDRTLLRRRRDAWPMHRSPRG